jgi:hypothetical protein
MLLPFSAGKQSKPFVLGAIARSIGLIRDRLDLPITTAEQGARDWHGPRANQRTFYGDDVPGRAFPSRTITNNVVDCKLNVFTLGDNYSKSNACPPFMVSKFQDVTQLFF